MSKVNFSMFSMIETKRSFHLRTKIEISLSVMGVKFSEEKKSLLLIRYYK